MNEGNKKGITVKIDAALHAQVREYLDAHNMTMAEFVTQALDNELHPKNDMKEGTTMANTRTLAIQIPEELFQRIKEYLQRKNVTQKQFLIGLIEDKLERDLTQREAEAAPVSEDLEPEAKYPAQAEDAAVGDLGGKSVEDGEQVCEEEQDVAPQESYLSYSMGMSM